MQGLRFDEYASGAKRMPDAPCGHGDGTGASRSAGASLMADACTGI